MTAADLSSSKSPSLSKYSLAAEWRALIAIARRDWITFIRYPSWFIAMIVWPLIFPLNYLFAGRALAGPDGSALKLFEQVAGTTDFAGYVAIGTTIWMWQNIVLWNIGYALRTEQVRGTLESSWMSPTWRFSMLVGSSFTHLLQTFIFLFVSFIEFYFFLGVRLNGSPLLVLLMLLAVIPSIYGLGFAFASLVISVKEANQFVFLVRGLVMIFAGITYPITLMPLWMQSVAKWIPPMYAIHGLREAALNHATFSQLIPDLLPLLGWGIFWLAAGYLIFQWMERRARQKGTIGHF